MTGFQRPRCSRGVVKAIANVRETKKKYSDNNGTVDRMPACVFSISLQQSSHVRRRNADVLLCTTKIFRCALLVTL